MSKYFLYGEILETTPVVEIDSANFDEAKGKFVKAIESGEIKIVPSQFFNIKIKEVKKGI